MIEHGGNLDEAAARYGIACARWLDLSTGISPYAYPVALDQDPWRRLPAETAGFRNAAAAYYGSAAFVAVPGSQAAIQLLPRLLAARSVAVARPSYAEHAAVWGRNGAEVTCMPEEALLEARSHDAVVICNPGSPTGRLAGVDALLALRERQAAGGGWLIVDEAFIDTEPQASLAAHAGGPGLVVLRSFGKFFGLAGARLGFLFGPPALLDAARAELGPWAVAGPALAVAERALADADFHARSRSALRQASRGLRGLLERHGYRVAGATDFFLWVAHAQARAVQDRLAREAVLVRAFDRPPGLRFGIPGTDEAWSRLEAALESL